MTNFGMKSTVLSDIDHEDSGIIPYALKMAKDLRSEVNVIHVIDTRISQGIYTPYSDSQSVTPGVESYQDILQKEKKKMEGYLGKHVGREASVLNFPLKVNYEVRLGHVDDIIKEETGKPNSNLLMMNAHPEGKVWESFEEIFDIIIRSKNPVLLIPPGLDYMTPQKITFITDLNKAESDRMHRVFELMHKIPFRLHALNITKTENFEQKLKSDPNWQGISGRIDNYSLLDHPDHTEILKIVTNHNSDMVILFEKKQNLLKRMTSKRLTEKLTEKSTVPLLVFYN
jgi:hypothetical protein